MEINFKFPLIEKNKRSCSTSEAERDLWVFDILKPNVK